MGDARLFLWSVQTGKLLDVMAGRTGPTGPVSFHLPVPTSSRAVCGTKRCGYGIYLAVLGP